MRRFVDLCRLVSNKTLALFEAGEKNLAMLGCASCLLSGKTA